MAEEEIAVEEIVGHACKPPLSDYFMMVSLHFFSVIGLGARFGMFDRSHGCHDNPLYEKKMAIATYTRIILTARKPS